MSALSYGFFIFPPAKKSTSRANSLQDIRPRILTVPFFQQISDVLMLQFNSIYRGHPTRLIRVGRTSHGKKKSSVGLPMRPAGFGLIHSRVYSAARDHLTSFWLGMHSLLSCGEPPTLMAPVSFNHTPYINKRPSVSNLTQNRLIPKYIPATALA